MNAWDIFDFDWPWGSHPAVIISNPMRVRLKPQVVVLSCRTLQSGYKREPEANEAILNSEDGLNWETLCKCDVVYAAPKIELVQRRGTVTPERRRAIAERVIRALGLAGL